MADHGRSREEREAARREREARRAAREGRAPRFEQAAEEFAADPPTFDAAAEPAAPETAAGPETAADPETAAGPETSPPSAPEGPPTREEPPIEEPLIEPRAFEPPPTEAHDAFEPPPLPLSEPRSIRSFPSPPDPEFYLPDEQLDTEQPSGTRRVNRRSSSGHGGAGRPPRGPSRAGAGATPVRRRHWRGRIAALIALLIVAAVVVFAIEIFQPFGSSPHGHVTVRIKADSSASEVATTLSNHGVISSAFFFKLRTELDGDRASIRAGTYDLQKGMSYGAVLKTLTTPPKAAKTSEITIEEGHTRQYVAKLLSKQHITGSYLADTRHSKLLRPRSYGAPKSTDTLEGFLFPDTFQLVDPPTAKALVADQLKDFKKRFATVKLGYAKAHHLSAFDVLTIASMIQAEAGAVQDMPKVASVIYNRLRDHMMLQLDSTARYATGNFTKALTETQLQSKSPYNTHTHYGLPPGPIDSPGLSALRAAAHPSTTKYLYFFSKPCTDRTVFATSYAQFNILLLRDKREHCPKKSR